MSLFGSMLRDFDDDPFFGGAHVDSMRRMENMMDGFMNPFEGMFGGGAAFGFPQLMAAPPHHHHHHQLPAIDDVENAGRNGGGGGGGGGARRGAGNQRRNQGDLLPFGFAARPMFPDINSMFTSMGQIANDPNCHTYSSSSVVTYSMGEDGQPKMYQASSSTRTAPGGVKETRKTMADSATGVQKMAIGHHLDERGHVIEKAKDGRTGQIDESQEFINLEETEADTFDREWQVRTTAAMGAAGPASVQYHSRNPYEQREAPQLAIAAGPSQDHVGRRRDGKGSTVGHPYSEKGRKPRNKRNGGNGSSRPRHETNM